ncbi:EamA family transporter RarD [Sneathiella marina]|uniref:EamA family transporter RarD n=1 Tax=Sneathiella marina TaxID=2950108 RepID=A0ABY4W1U5_9PROT|nr:EamA family transporter RarD [Sneathiella marina]USG61145.1 EamA family transporter RarD [Sneathiella marina]
MTETSSSGKITSKPSLFTPEESRGLLSALGAFLIWGVAPVYFKWLSHVSPLEIISHRIVWSLIFVLFVVVATKNLTHFIAIFKDKQKLVIFCATTILIGLNWLTFIWAIANDRILEGSLGYYINPLVNILLGMLFLGERLNKWQTVSVSLAAVAVAIMTWQIGVLPWVSLILAISFGFYALLHKKVQVAAPVGLAVETTILFPFALGFVLYLTFTSTAGSSAEIENTGFSREAASLLLLIGTGVVTAMPLMLFSNAARYLKLTTIGVMQYLAPTMHMVIAIYIYNEPFDSSRLVAFGLIWIGLVIFSVDGYRNRKRMS